MTEQAILKTVRLQLRPFSSFDAPMVQSLAGDRAVADTTQLIPHPYEDGMAEKWIASQPSDFQNGLQVVYAVTQGVSGQLIGAVSLTITRANDCAAIGYWIGRNWWNQGFATEASAALLQFGFLRLALHRIEANHLVRNPASGRVMTKIGMRYEGRQQQAVKKWGIYEDVDWYAIIRGS